MLRRRGVLLIPLEAPIWNRHEYFEEAGGLAGWLESRDSRRAWPAGLRSASPDGKRSSR